jgi:hypothetical protein
MMCGELEKDNIDQKVIFTVLTSVWLRMQLLGRSLGWCGVKALRAFEMFVKMYW